MPTQEQPKTAKTPKFYSRHNLPPVNVAPAGDSEVPVYGFAYKDGAIDIVLKGHRNPKADIDAARKETLTEMLDRMSGRTPLEKVRNAVNLGLIAQNEAGPDAKYIDLTGVPTSIVEAQETIAKGQAAAASLPKDFTKGETDLTKILGLFTEEQLKAYLESKQPKVDSKAEPKEGDK